MELQEITERPSISSFTPLSQHQEETPSTFFGGPAVLHAYSSEAKLRLRRQDYDETAAVQKLGTAAAEADGDVEISELEVWVTSSNLIIFSPSKSSGIQIPYQSIALHALLNQDSQQTILLQITPPDAHQIPNEEDLKYLEVKLIPLSISDETQRAEDHDVELDSSGVNGSSASSPVVSLFNAISACSELNPDPEDGEDEEPSLGAGGWITAENMDQFVDEDGQFIGSQTLGSGAGTVRPRDGDDARFEDDEDGEGGEDESKWRRTE